MNITISTQILAGNLGDGWTDNNAAADALADFTRKTWTADLAEIMAEGHRVEINIDVQKGAGGYAFDLRVETDTWEMDEWVEGLLTKDQDLRDKFCRSEEAARLSNPLIDGANRKREMTTKIQSWKDQLPNDLTYSEFDEDFLIEGRHYQHGAWNSSGDWWLAWNTDEEFKKQLQELRSYTA